MASGRRAEGWPPLGLIRRRAGGRDGGGSRARPAQSRGVCARPRSAGKKMAARGWRRGEGRSGPAAPRAGASGEAGTAGCAAGGSSAPPRAGAGLGRPPRAVCSVAWSQLERTERSAALCSEAAVAGGRIVRGSEGAFPGSFRLVGLCIETMAVSSNCNGEDWIPFENKTKPSSFP